MLSQLLLLVAVLSCTVRLARAGEDDDITMQSESAFDGVHIKSDLPDGNITVTAANKNGPLVLDPHKRSNKSAPTVYNGTTERQGGLPELSYTNNGYLVEDLSVDIIYYSGHNDFRNDGTPEGISLFVNTIQWSNWFDILEQYYDSNGDYYVRSIQTDVISEQPSYKYGKMLTEKNIKKLLKDKLYQSKASSGSISNLNLIVLDPTVGYPGLCTESCGFHSYMVIGGQNVYYAVIGNPYYCQDFSACSVLNPNDSNSPNDNAELDSMVNVIAHELSEHITNPHNRGYHTSGGEENADLCSWQFRDVQTDNGGLPNPSGYFNECTCFTCYLLQANWVLPACGHEVGECMSGNEYDNFDYDYCNKK